MNRYGFRTLARGLACGLLVFTMFGDTALASSGLRTGFWSSSGTTLSTSSFAYSNATAFWQNIVNSTARCVPVDGIFGSVTDAATAAVKGSAEFNISPANGVVDSATWNGMQFSQVGGIYRHLPTGYTDGFGDQYYTYYGGGNEALMAWNPYVPQWFLNPYRISQAGQTTGWTLIAASANRTIGSYNCAA